MTANDVVFLFTDLEPEIVARVRTNTQQQILLSTSVAVRAAKELRIPVIASCVRLGPGQTPTAVEELGEAELIPRQHLNAWVEPELRARILSSKRRILAIGGIATDVAVLQTTLSALRDGFAVHVLTDACGGLTARSEDSALQSMQYAGAVLSGVPSLVGDLVPDIFSPTGRALMDILSPFWSADQ